MKARASPSKDGAERSIGVGVGVDFAALSFAVAVSDKGAEKIKLFYLTTIL